MTPRIVTVCLFILAVLVWNVAVGDEVETEQQSQDAHAGLRQEVQELKKAIAELDVRLEKIERRISRLGQPRTRIEPHAGGAPAGLRPLGSHLMIDRNGIIRDRTGNPVGIWGVNGSPFASPDGAGPSLSPQAR